MTSKYEGHTPAPWIVDGEMPASLFILDEKKERQYAMIKGATDERDAANARLIADAPSLLAQRDDLLAALKAVMTWIKNWDPNFTEDEEWPADSDKAKAAIAKAEGR